LAQNDIQNAELAFWSAADSGKLDFELFTDDCHRQVTAYRFVSIFLPAAGHAKTGNVFCRASHASFSLEADVAAAQLGHIVLIWAAKLAAYRLKKKSPAAWYEKLHRTY
jgi:hypothetical protein